MKTLLSLRNCLLAMMLSMTCLSPAIWADDTEIFFGQSNDAFNTNPNVLFVLDTSGSMSYWDDADSSRMDRMKAAMRTLLQQSSSFNVGLMGFSGWRQGGHIRYPVGDLEGNSGDLCDSSDGTECPDEVVIVKPGSGNDDATQNDDTLEVILDSSNLIMAGLTNDNTNSPTTSIETNTVDGNSPATSVAAEYLDIDGPVSRSVTSSASWFYNPTAGDNKHDRHAYRFENITIPKGATITAANIQFSYTSSISNQSGNVTTLIKLESVANTTALPDGVNGTQTISQRLDPTTATAGIEWDVPAVLNGETTATSPDISEILQQVVNLPQWASGNPVSVLLDPVEEYSATLDDVREFFGLDAAPGLHPVLTYSYSETVESETSTTIVSASAHLDEITNQNNDEVSRNLASEAARLFFADENHFPRELAFRFDNIDIPANAEIQTATLVLTGANKNDVDPNSAWVVDSSTSPVIEDDTGTPDNDAAGDTLPAPDADSDVVIITDPDASSEDNVILGNIKAELTGSPTAYSSTPLVSRTLSTEFVTWTGIDPTPNEVISSPNIADVVTAVINQDGWSAGDSLSIVLTPPRATYNNVDDNTSAIHTSASNKNPELHITWKETTVIDTTLSNSQTTAIRFQNVHVPPGAVVKTANLVFNSDAANIDETVLEISAELVPESEPFEAVNNNIGQRVRSSQRVNWTVPPWENPNVEYSSVDISSVVSSVTGLPEWCSGNPLTIFIKKQLGDDNRVAKAFEANPQQAPSLRITYEASSVDGEFCANSTALGNVVSNDSDAVEDVTNNTLYVDEATLDTINSTSGAAQTIGLRFSGVAIDPNTPIVKAVIELTPATDIAQASDINIAIASDTDNWSFSDTDPSRKIIARPKMATTVTQTIPSMQANLSRAKLDVTDLVNAKVSADGWAVGQRMVFALDSQSSVNQSFYSYEGDDALAPRLIIEYQSTQENPGTRFRENLIAIVDDLVAQGGTPIVSSYYEAALYYTGQNVDYGLKRGAQYDSDRFHRVSHPASYTNGTVNRAPGCSDTDLNSSACASETIVSDGTGAPRYISPMVSECQQNHIVLLSDGQPTSNTAADKVRAMTGDTSCAATDWDEACGVELAEYLNNTDLNDALDGVQNIKTHTIGFNLEAPAFLQQIAAAGDGGFYEAESTEELLAAFQTIFNNVSQTDTSFVAPSTTVSQSNRLKNRDDLYFSLFKPEGTARWDGNLKRYKLKADPGDDADIVDYNDNNAINPDTGMFYNSAKSWWSTEADGNTVAKGGAAERLERAHITHFDRNVYTYTGGDTNLSTGPYNQLLPNTEYFDNDWLKLPATLANDADYITNLVYWARGRDEFDIDGDQDTEEVRGQIGDPLHTQPVLVNYAGDRTVVHIATNEGFLHAIDHDSGNENFAFIPKELLKNLRALYENEPTQNRPYGLDGGMSVWIKDINKNGIVDAAGDKAYLYFGMRRGGNLYYALDITDPDNPVYMWSIAGGATTANTEEMSGIEDLTTADGDFQQLGQTWSKPIKTKIYDDNVIRDVLVFGAGYDTNQDPSQSSGVDADGNEIEIAQTRQTDNVGRGFFIVDALTGDLLWKPNLVDPDYSDMQYSVPSDIRVIDLNFDGLVDQFYFGDMGGQVWRFDYNNNPNASESMDNRMTGGVIGSFAGDTPETARRFFYPPDVALINIDGEQQLSVSIGSGWRAHPLDDVVEDQFYSFRMKQVYGAPVNSDGEVRYPMLDQDYSTMYDVLNEDFTATKNTRGWYFDLDQGEKVLSSSITVDNKLVFTSYVPSIQTGFSCEAAIGSGYVYIVDLASGNPVYNLASSTTDQGASIGSGGKTRRKALSHSGIPPAPSILFPELGKATTFVGRDKIEEIEIETLKTRTFWQEFVESDL